MSVQYVETNKTINIYKCTDGVSGDEYILKSYSYVAVEKILARKKVNFEKLIIEEFKLKGNKRLKNVYLYNKAKRLLYDFLELEYELITIIEYIQDKKIKEDSFRFEYELRTMNEYKNVVFKIYFKAFSDEQAKQRIQEFLKGYTWESVLLLNYTFHKITLVVNENYKQIE